MSQLGSGNGSSYPTGIDTRQTWQNAVASAPDSATRLDAEALNDICTALLAIETALGAVPQGNLGSVAARLNQYLPGTGSAPSILDFATRISLSVPGTQHRLGTRGLLAQLYTNAIPAAAFEPAALTVDASTYDVLALFGDPASGSLVLSGATPYIRDFTTTTSVTVLGTAHGFGTADLLWRLYDNTEPAGQITAASLFAPNTLTVHPSTFDVVVTFADPMTGYLVLEKPLAGYAASFTSQTTVTVPGATHGLGTRGLLYQLWDASTPRNALAPDTLTVHPTTHDVVATFADPTSGRVVLDSVADFSGTDFTIQDGGVVDRTATRVYSRNGDLSLQAGSGAHIYWRNKLGTIRATLTDAGQLGIGTTAPTHQLELSTDSAAKPTTSAWTIFSDERLKEVLAPFEDGLAVLLQLEAVWYRYNGQGGMAHDGKAHIGYLAQALHAVAPYMVGSARGKLTPTSEDTDILTYNSHAMDFLQNNALKEVDGRLARLEALYATLHAAVATLQTTLSPEEGSSC